MRIPSFDLHTAGLILLQLAAALTGAVFHEVAHGAAALKLGDTTARDAGRLTLNPLAHIDLFSTVLLPAVMIIMGLPPLILFKPVPININNLKNPRRDSRIVSLAGPLANFALVLIAAVIYQLFFSKTSIEMLYAFFYYLIIINFFLGVFNLIPIPPLDGSWILLSFLPRQALIRFEKMRTWLVVIFLILIFSGLLNFLLSPILKFLDTIAKILLIPDLFGLLFRK